MLVKNATPHAHALSGTVVGVLLNHRPALAALGDAANAPPHGAAPRAPVLYIKPRNTLAADGDAIELPPGVPALQVGATLGLVIGRAACRVAEADALSHLAGCVIANDLCVPHASFFRPQIHHRVRDRFCPLGATLRPVSALGDLDALAVRVFIDGECVQRTDTADRIRPAARLLADISAFMTLQPGDVLLLGPSAGAPLARAGQRVAIEIDGLGRLENTLVEERRAAPKPARIPSGDRWTHSSGEGQP